MMTNKHLKRTYEEKENLITAFLKSNQSMTKWCKEHQISLSTFNGWMKKRKGNVTFIPLESPVNPFQKSTPNELHIEFRDFKITIGDHSSMLLLESTLNVVKNLYVSL